MDMNILSDYGFGFRNGSGTGTGDYANGTILGTNHVYITNREAYAQAILSQWKRKNAVIAFWKSDANGYSINGGNRNSLHKVGDVERVKGPLKRCSSHALHATFRPWIWLGSRLFIVALKGEIQEDRYKLAALEREIIEEIIPNPWVN